MILVDDQSGSITLFPYIQQRTPDVILTRIASGFGDVAWVADGRDQKPVRTGVEYKKLNDVLDCIVSGRFSDVQLPGMLLNYDRIHLLVEMGRSRFDRHTGILQQMWGKDWRDVYRNGRGYHYRDLEHWFTTFEEFAQLRVHVTFDEHESAQWVVAKHSWWTGKKWDDHDAMKKFYVAPPPVIGIERPKFVHRVAKEYPNIGWDKAFAVGNHFGTVLEMVNANQARWEEIDGIGRTIASRAFKAVRGEGG